jgi:hypothetical protein
MISANHTTTRALAVRKREVEAMRYHGMMIDKHGTIRSIRTINRDVL